MHACACVCTHTRCVHACMTTSKNFHVMRGAPHMQMLPARHAPKSFVDYYSIHQFLLDCLLHRRTYRNMYRREKGFRTRTKQQIVHERVNRANKAEIVLVSCLPNSGEEQCSQSPTFRGFFPQERNGNRAAPASWMGPRQHAQSFFSLMSACLTL